MKKQSIITGITHLPSVLSECQYNEYLLFFKRSGYLEAFTRAYIKNEQDNLYYFTSSKLNSTEKQRLWDVYWDINQQQWYNIAVEYIIAHWIFRHRVRINRKGDSFDDLMKSRYLISLAQYISCKHSSVIILCEDQAIEEIINEVNNIFDSAYFKQFDKPYLSNDERFFEAEREYCEEKKIDFLVYQLRDYSIAEKISKKPDIEALANQYYLWRISNGVLGNEKSDWDIAESRYPSWRMTKRIAGICWNLSTDQYLHPDYYWSKACLVIEMLTQANIDYLNKSPFDKIIFDKIKELCACNDKYN